MSLLSVMSLLLVLVFLAYLIETLLEALLSKVLRERWSGWSQWSWLMFVPAVGLGVYAAILYRLDFLFLLGSFLEQVLFDLTGQEQPLGLPQTVFGYVITGVGVGMGSTYVHDLIGRYFKKSSLPDPGP
jgi:hypothetical protein